MKNIVIHLLVFLLIISCSSNQNSKNQNSLYDDGLDQIGKSSLQNNRMRDVYRAYYVRNICFEIDNYLYNQFILNPKYVFKTLPNGIRKKNYYVIYPDDQIQIQKNKLSLIQGIKFNDKKIQHLSNQCINRIYYLLYQIRPSQKMYFNGTRFSSSLNFGASRMFNLQKYISKYYDINTFTELSEKTFWEKNDKINYIKDIRYQRYKQYILENKYDKAIHLLRAIISDTKDFQEQTIYKIQLADQIVSHDIKQHSKKHFYEALLIYRSILNTNKYSLYLFETWVKWRSLQQATIGFTSKDKVQNRLHEKVRLETLKTIFRFLQKHPKDPMAINSFLTLSSHENLFQYEKKDRNTEDFMYYFKSVKI